MRTLLISFFALVISFGLVVPDAEAKRLGGGSSFGKSFLTPKSVQPAAPTKQQSATTNGTTAQKAAQPKRRGFGGLMGGLLAGGLLGALFFGGGFDGIQFMDILLIGLFGFIAYKIFAGMKRSQQSPQYAGHNRHSHASDVNEKPQQFEAPAQPQPQSSPVSGAGFGMAAADFQLPEWFNEKAFLEGAQQHFVYLQKAWDNSDWADIESYTSAEVFSHLQSERSKLPEQQNTEVVSVMAEMANFIDNKDHVIATINFYGWTKEDGNEAAEFSELWHLSRDMTANNGDWVIVGIEQS
ncbi:MAG: TIM44-like domain-containing protein [Amphritea sp.]